MDFILIFSQSQSHISQSQSHISHNRRMNKFVMLLMLFVVAGYCSGAMAIASEMAVITDQASSSSSPCGDVVDGVDKHSSTDPCLDDHCPDTSESLQSPTSKQTKDQLADLPLLIAVASELPFARAGPCRVEPLPASADFSTPPLFYTLCVLRL